MLFAGAAQTERQSVSAAAAMDRITREEAFAAIETMQPLRFITRNVVCNHWVDKRKRGSLLDCSMQALRRQSGKACLQWLRWTT